MSTGAIYLSAIALSAWCFLGTVLYWEYHNEIPNKKKKLLFRVVCGPTIWLVLIVATVFRAIGIMDSILSTFIDWIRKP